MNWKYKLSLAAAAFFALTVGGTPTAFAAPPKDACSLLTTAQVSGVLGMSVEAGKPPSPTITTLCHWGDPRLGVKSRKGVMLTTLEADHWAYIIMPIGHGIVKDHVKGLGDDAIYGTTPGMPTVLDVKKGNAAFQVVVTGFSPDENQAKEKALALDVLAKL